MNLKTSLLGWTPLHYAVLSDHNHIVDYLISQGADVNFKTGIQNMKSHAYGVPKDPKSFFSGYNRMSHFLKNQLKTCDCEIRISETVLEFNFQIQCQQALPIIL